MKRLTADRTVVGLLAAALHAASAAHPELQTLFERLLAEAGEGGACPLLWRAYLAYELGRGRPQVPV